MKTTTKLKLIAILATISLIPKFVPKEIYIMYMKFYNALMKAKLENPNLTWKGFKI